MAYWGEVPEEMDEETQEIVDILKELEEIGSPLPEPSKD